jgi:hypothetical protein
MSTFHSIDNYIIQLKISNQTRGKALPEDGAISAETCRAVLIIIQVFYCMCAVHCWYIKYIITTHKMEGMESFKTISMSNTLFGVTERRDQRVRTYPLPI